MPSEFDPTTTLAEILEELSDGRRPLQSDDVCFKLEYLAAHLKTGGSLPDVAAALPTSRPTTIAQMPDGADELTYADCRRIVESLLTVRQGLADRSSVATKALTFDVTPSIVPGDVLVSFLARREQGGDQTD